MRLERKLVLCHEIPATCLDWTGCANHPMTHQILTHWIRSVILTLGIHKCVSIIRKYDEWYNSSALNIIHRRTHCWRSAQCWIGIKNGIWFRTRKEITKTEFIVQFILFTQLIPFRPVWTMQKKQNLGIIWKIIMSWEKKTHTFSMQNSVRSIEWYVFITGEIIYNDQHAWAWTMDTKFIPKRVCYCTKMQTQCKEKEFTT